MFSSVWSVFGLLSCISTKSVKIITSAVSMQLHGTLLNGCTFLLSHKVKYCMVTSDVVLMILQYTWQKESHTCSFLHYTAVGLFDAVKDLGYLQKHQLDLIYVSFIFIRTKNDFCLGVGGRCWGHENVSSSLNKDFIIIIIIPWHL